MEIAAIFIRVWRFKDAPQIYQDLSQHGGDEDWLAEVPPELDDVWIPWLESGGPFGVSEVSVINLESGYKVYIGAHA